MKPAGDDAARIQPWRDAKTQAVHDQAIRSNTSGRRRIMSRLPFDTFFQIATEKPAPYGYQCRLACGPDADHKPETLREGTTCQSQLINIPTGLGKTAAVVLAWLWNRAHLQNPKWPRRLVYCLPMRTLVEQTAGEVKTWVANILADQNDELADDAEAKAKLEWLRDNGPVILMGGEDAGEWDIHPEREAILIGTQDMLLSRALNRGYAAGRARWPKDFALLNNDCLWVFDEVQLMSTGFATSLQLQAWRERGGMKPALPTFSWWMSATLDKGWLTASIDFLPRIEVAWAVVGRETNLLWDVDTQTKSDMGKRVKALLTPGVKEFHPKSPPQLKAEKLSEYIEKVAKAVKAARQEFPSEKILVIVNTVERACALAEKLKAEAPLLLHSRFRHRERKAWIGELKSENLIIATQVVEAGVDISSRILFTELCPWPSFIQRCGRAARNPGEKADIYWMDVSKVPAPYSENEMAAAKGQLEKLTDASLAGLRAHRNALTAEEVFSLLPYSPRFVPQSKDLIEFFDTTPDLTGADVDISRYIRDGQEHDVSVFWRDCSNIRPGKNPPKDRSWKPEHAELCAVPVWGESGFREFTRKASGRIWRLDYRDGWTLLNRGDEERIFPGQVFLLEKSCGGYDPTKGWTGQTGNANFEIGPWKAISVLSGANEEAEENPVDSGDDVESSDGGSNSGQNGLWRTILAHTREVCEEFGQQLQSFPLDSPADGDARVVLPLAARLHDWGKAHIAFKHKVKPDELAKAASAVPDRLPAKAPDDCWRRDKQKWQSESTPEIERDLRRAGFRHELASALAILELLRRHRPDHSALAWSDGELRSKFASPQTKASEPLADTALAEEIVALTASQFNLLIYLVAAHHGKVRMSLRSSPDDLRDDVPWPCPPDVKQARGVRDGDTLPSVALPSADYGSAQVSAPAISLRLDVMELGLSVSYGPSWRERAEALLTKHGPFRLAWYEALLRIADQRASKYAEAKSPTA